MINDVVFQDKCIYNVIIYVILLSSCLMIDYLINDIITLLLCLFIIISIHSIITTY